MKPIASYSNPNPVTGDIDERVISIISELDGSTTIKTISGRRTYTYRGVQDFTGAVDEFLTEKPKHKFWSLAICWSPFDHDPNYTDE